MKVSIPDLKNISKVDTTLAGLISLIGYPSYYFIWTAIYPQPYENLYLRISVAILGLAMILRGSWPLRLKPYFPFFWYASMLYGLPFFFTFMLLENSFNLVWVSSATSAIFLVIIIVHWLLAILIIQLGVMLGWFVYYVFGSASPIPGTDILMTLPLFGFAIVVGLVINYRHTTTVRETERYRSSTAVISNLAHELRTPLQAIESGALGVEKYLPDLFIGYEAAQAAKLDTPYIPPARYPIIKSGMQRIYQLAQQGNYIVSMAARNLTTPSIDDSLFECIDIEEAVKKAISSYPYNKRDQINLIETNEFTTFRAKVSETLVIHIIYNLLQNAFYYLAKSPPGSDSKINIRTQVGRLENELIVTDTGTGIQPDVLPHIFERFYTRTPGGIGVGLSFVKQAMEAFGGSISCDSVYGEYTRFVLKFPVAKQE